MKFEVLQISRFYLYKNCSNLIKSFAFLLLLNNQLLFLDLPPSQHICKIFDLLNKKMAEEFNPETLYDCFHNKMNQRILADIVHTYLQDIPTNQH